MEHQAVSVVADIGSGVLQNGGTFLPDYMVSAQNDSTLHVHLCENLKYHVNTSNTKITTKVENFSLICLKINKYEKLLHLSIILETWEVIKLQCTY
jgi:hypothetical protein